MRKKKKGGELPWVLVLSAVLVAALFLLPLGSLEGEEEHLFGREEGGNAVLPPFESGKLDGERMLRVLDGESVIEMDLGTYLVGVVRAEMPASFPEQALKAQTVAARTYTLYKLAGGTNHENADICTDHTCCQAYLEEETARENWGGDAAYYEEKVRAAVKGTDGEVMLYEGAPIQAVFHSASAGLTRSAGEVWTTDLPYLQPVDSPEAADRIPNYYSRVEFTAAEFKEKFLAAYPEADLSEAVSDWISGAVTDSAGSVEHITIGSVQVKGTQVRSIFGLRSACFTWEAGEKGITFFVTGYGHGVGMSQYGAGTMAEEGADYREILTHYYSGVEIQNIGA